MADPNCSYHMFHRMGRVREASWRIKQAGVQNKAEVMRLAIENLETLLPIHKHRYDIILADFGALNLSGNPERWQPQVAGLLKPGGKLVATVVNRWCAWDVVAGLLRGKPLLALRRTRGKTVLVGGIPLDVRVYTPGEFSRRLSSRFQLQYVAGLCTIAPPPASEHLLNRMPRLRKILHRLDVLMGTWWLVQAWGDHFLVVLQKKSAVKDMPSSP